MKRYDYMKKVILFIFIVTFISACHFSTEIDKKLSDAETIMEDKPDTALYILNNIDTTSFNNHRQKALYYLLHVQAEFKTYQKIITNDSLLEFSIEYFENNNEQELLARSLFYRGRTMEIYRKQIFEALPYIKRSQYVAEEVNDLLLLSKIYESLGYIAGKSLNNRIALRYNKLLYSNSVERKDSFYILRSLAKISNNYANLEQFDSCNFFIAKCIPLIEKYKHDKEIAWIYTRIGNMYKRINKNDSAKYFYAHAIKLDNNVRAYKALGDIYYKEHNDSMAIKMWEYVLRTNKNSWTGLKTLESVYRYYAYKGEKENLLDIAVEANNMSNDLLIKAKTEKFATLFNKLDEQHQKKKLEKSKEANNYFAISLILASIIIIAALLLIKKYHNSNKKQSDIIDDKHKQIETLKTESEEKENYIKEKMSELTSKEKKIESLERKIETQSANLLDEVSRGKAVFNNLTQNKDTYKLDIDREKYLIKYYEFEHKRTVNNWKVKYGELTRRMSTYLILIDMGFTEKEIVQTLEVTEGALRTLKSRMKCKEDGM